MAEEHLNEKALISIGSNIVHIGIVGGGAGGSRLINLFAANEKARICFVCDVNENAPAMIRAQKMRIPIATDIDMVLSTNASLIFNTTGSEKVEKILSEKFAGKKVSIVTGDVAQQLFTLLRDDDNDEDTMKGRYLIFDINKESYGVPIVAVKEIVGVPHISCLPDMPNYVVGVMNLRDAVIPVVDLRIRFHMPKMEYTERTAVVVITLEERLFGLIVDSVDSVVEIAASQKSEPPMVAASSAHRFLEAIGRTNSEVRLLLEVRSIFEELIGAGAI